MTFTLTLTLTYSKKKMKRHFLWIPFVALMACSHEPSAEEKALQSAREAARQSYESLLAGRYDEFLAGRAYMADIPDNYREELIASYKQFMAQQREFHGGIGSIAVSDARIDSTLQLIQVFLILNYRDSTQEEIVIPMVEQDGQWKMK
jgi:hypothetical protein